MEKLKVPKTDRKLVETLTPKEVDQLFSVINSNSAFGARNCAMVALFLDSGLRLSELSGLEEENVHLDDWYIKVIPVLSKEFCISQQECQPAGQRSIPEARSKPD